MWPYTANKFIPDPSLTALALAPGETCFDNVFDLQTGNLLMKAISSSTYRPVVRFEISISESVPEKQGESEDFKILGPGILCAHSTHATLESVRALLHKKHT